MLKDRQQIKTKQSNQMKKKNIKKWLKKWLKNKVKHSNKKNLYYNQNGRYQNQD